MNVLGRWVGIWVSRAHTKRQCTLEGKAQYVNALGSIHWKGVHTGSANFFLIIKIDQSETTKSYMLNMPLRLTNRK